LAIFHGRTSAARSSDQGLGSEFIVHVPLGEPIMTHGVPIHGPIDCAGVRHRILVVDNDCDAAVSLEWLLEGMGKEVLIAHSGSEAIDMAESFLPHLVLMDLEIPGIDGYEVCRRMRGKVWGRRIPIVALAGWDLSWDPARTQGAGFSRHLTKPFCPVILGEVLASLLVEAKTH
jgi:CheY-like chemotaxis protein